MAPVTPSIKQPEITFDQYRIFNVQQTVSNPALTTGLGSSSNEVSGGSISSRELQQPSLFRNTLLENSNRIGRFEKPEIRLVRCCDDESGKMSATDIAQLRDDIVRLMGNVGKQPFAQYKTAVDDVRRRLDQALDNAQDPAGRMAWGAIHHSTRSVLKRWEDGGKFGSAMPAEFQRITTDNFNNLLLILGYKAPTA